MNDEVSKLEKKIEIKFKDKKLLINKKFNGLDDKLHLLPQPIVYA